MPLDLPLILEPAQLQEHLEAPDIRLVDLGDPARYQEAHVPGAVHVHPALTQRGTPPAPGALPDREALQALMDSLGITPETQLVVYDQEGGGWAGRFIWLLDCVGHSRYSYLNGGWLAWSAEGRPVASGNEQPPARPYPLRLEEEPTASLEDVRAALDNPNVQIWDARSGPEFRGERSPSARPGHIPGARHLEWTRVMDPQNHYRLRSPEQILALMESAGIDRGRHLITHCQTHHRSGLTYLVGKWLGVPRIQGYAGSWAEWGNRSDTPVESDT